TIGASEPLVAVLFTGSRRAATEAVRYLPGAIFPQDPASRGVYVRLRAEPGGRRSSARLGSCGRRQGTDTRAYRRHHGRAKRRGLRRTPEATTAREALYRPARRDTSVLPPA